MVLRIIAHLNEIDGGPKEAAIELDDFTLLFLDSVLAEIKAKLGIDPSAPFDYFECKHALFLSIVNKVFKIKMMEIQVMLKQLKSFNPYLIHLPPMIHYIYG